ncbi:MAG: CDP-alcohol phosphatidyltransferase family protein [Caldilineaceae bacterium]|nr:CDP-alcohol phosphatidyltransferase family protein [Caldilineaceae bacterium]
MDQISLSSVASGDDSWSPSDKQRLLAWLTHLFTASGAVWGLLSVIAITAGEWQLAFVWMAAAVFVDSFDGFIARRTRVKLVLPEFDGALLDNIIDYLNYVFVPAYFLYAAELLPPDLRLMVTSLILLSSAYQFSQTDAKTDDHFFKGFPSYWNIVVFYMVVMGTAQWLNAALMIFFCVMVFVPIKYIYPSRTTLFRRLTMGLGLLWGLLNLIVLIQFPNHAPWLVSLSLAYAIYYVLLSLYVVYGRAARNG